MKIRPVKLIVDKKIRPLPEFLNKKPDQLVVLTNPLFQLITRFGFSTEKARQILGM